MSESRAIAVAVVDDEGDIVSVIATGLGLRGVRAVRAGSAAEAMGLIDADPAIGVVVADINMPGRSGLSMAAELAKDRDEARALEFIFITGLGTAETIAEALRQGAFDFIQKPFSLHDLMERVAAAQQRCAERRARAEQLSRMDSAVTAAHAERRRLIEALAQTEAALDQAEKARANLFAVITHELRTPLIPVIGLSSLLVEDQTMTIEKARDFGAVIHESGRSLLGLIETALDVLALDADVGALKLRPVPLHRLVDAARRRAKAQDIQVESGPAEEDSVAADRDRMERAIAAVLDNAMKASTQHDRVRLRHGVTADGDALVEVSDDGPGAPEDVLAQLGRPFLQADMTSTRAWPGAGLGLAFATRVLAGHGGGLVLSRRRGGGTTARLAWPAKPGSKPLARSNGGA